jgi:hypothetical protein
LWSCSELRALRGATLQRSSELFVELRGSAAPSSELFVEEKRRTGRRNKRKRSKEEEKEKT